MRALLVIAAAVACTAPSALAGRDDGGFVNDGETVYIKLGQRFRGDFGADGGVVYANFNVLEGTAIDLLVNSRGVHLGLAMVDSSGSDVDLGNTVREEGAEAEIDGFVIPVSGNYTLVLSAVPGAGAGGPGGGLNSLKQSISGEFLASSGGMAPEWYNPGTLSGTVVNALTAGPIEGAQVYIGPYMLVTDENGQYSGEFQYGGYDVMFEADYFEEVADDAIVFPLLETVLDAVLMPVAPVVVETSLSGSTEPGGTVEAHANVIVLDGSTIETYEWMQVVGVDAIISGGDTDTAMVELGARGDYKEWLFHILAEPPIAPEDLPPNVPPPPGEFPGGIQNRFGVVGLNPWSLEEAALVGLEVMVTTSSGTYMADTEVHTAIPWKVNSAIRNVPIGVPVLLNGKEQVGYDWLMTPPDLSDAELVDPTSQHPEFIADVPGLYEFSVFDEGSQEQLTFNVYAGNWKGIIVGQDEDGLPIPNDSCNSCHQQLSIGNMFTDWRETGHARIFSDNLDTSTHYGTNCFPCHTVGFDPDVMNSGFDDAADYDEFIAAGLLNNPGDNWTRMLDEFPLAARRANIQCENCHGPQDQFPGQTNPAHRRNTPRITLSSDNCATCHGEPLRHARFQQWQLSAHANYELAIDEGESGNCSRCHTVNGFLTWLPVLLGDEEGDPMDNIEVTWTVDEVHPQTCVTCHDPHNLGTTSGEDTDATVRISGNTPKLIAGFRAFGVGRGAVCMTCHNSRRGLRNDDVWPDYEGTSEAVRAPHGSAQTDLIMGQNAYLIDVGRRGNHSFVTDVCVSCHMEKTPPPALLSYNQGGTNHTFYASIDICVECHDEGLEGEFIQEGVEDTLHILQDLIEESYLALMTDLTDDGNTIDFNGDLQITDTSVIAELTFTESRGRQALIVKLTDEQEFGPYAISSIDVIDQNQQVIGSLYEFAGADLPKAGWNYALVHNDGSLGVHNPSFAYAALEAAINALDPLASIEVPSWIQLGWEKSSSIGSLDK